jgi:hypothetical protein
MHEANAKHFHISVSRVLPSFSHFLNYQIQLFKNFSSAEKSFQDSLLFSAAIGAKKSLPKK